MPALTRSSQVALVTASSVEVTNGMQVGQAYALICTEDCWFRIAVTTTSAVAGAANNVFLPKGVYVEIKAEDVAVAFVSAIRATADGTLNLILLEG